MKFRTTLVLLVVAICIGGYIWLYEKKQMSTDEREEKGARVFHAAADDIDRVELDRGGGAIVCVRDKDGEWQLEKPLAYKADKSQLRSICGRIETLKSERVLPAKEVDDKKLEEFGLKKPRLTMRFHSPAGGGGLSVGEDTALGESLYARADGTKDVLVVPKGIYTALNKETKDLRDRGILEFDSADLGSVKVTRGGKSVELAQENGAWRLAAPVAGMADPDRVGGLLRRVRGLRVRDFVNDAPKDLGTYGLAAPEAEVALAGKNDGTVRTLLVGKEAEKGARYVKTAGRESVFTVGADIMKEMTADPSAFRDLKPTRLAEGQVNEIRIERGGAKLVLARSGEKWEIREPQKCGAEDGEVGRLLSAVTGPAQAEYVSEKAEDPAAYGFGKDATVVTLVPKEGVEERLTIGGRFGGGKKVYLRREKGGEVLAAGAELLDSASTDPLKFRDRQVVDFRAQDVKRLSVSGPKLTRTVCEREGNEWRMAEPAPGKADAGAVTAVISELSRLRAEGFVARSPEDLKEYGLDAPPVEASVECDRAGKTETITLLVGSRAGKDSFYAMRAGEDTVFTIPSRVEGMLHRDLAAKPSPASSPGGKAAGGMKN